MGHVYSAYIGSPDTAPVYTEPPTFDPNYGFPSGRKERGKCRELSCNARNNELGRRQGSTNTTSLNTKYSVTVSHSVSVDSRLSNITNSTVVVLTFQLSLTWCLNLCCKYWLY